MCRIASLFLLHRLKGIMSGDARDFKNIETRDIIKFFFLARQGTEGNLRHSDRNIRGTCIIVCHGQIGWSSLNVVKLAYLGLQCLDHPPNFSDLAPSYYHLFLGLKKQLKGPTRRSLLPRRPGWTDNLLNIF